MLRRPLLPIYLLALFLVGLGYIAMMPPFEGMDETFHYASLRQIADIGTVPLYGKSFVPQDVIDYRGPVAYSTGQPPFDTGMVYTKFFSRPDLIDRYAQDYRSPKPRPAYAPSAQLNAQAQHPPLYYLLLAPLLRIVEPMNIVSQFLILRLASYLLAIGGGVFGILAVRSSNIAATSRGATIGFMLYPIILPMFFPEFARIGNDSLCLMLTGLSAFFLARSLTNERRLGWPVALGICLGLGLLTKALFLPITFAIGVFLLLRIWQNRTEKSLRGLRWRNAVVTGAFAVMIGGIWYVYSIVAYGQLVSSEDAIKLARHGGLLGGLLENFSLYILARGAVVTFVTWIWTGTSSEARMSQVLYAPMILFVLLTIGIYTTRLRRAPLNDVRWLPVLLFGIFVAGLLYHVLIDVANAGSTGTGGWYLHILMPWAAPALGAGIVAMLEHPRLRLLAIGLASYAVLFQVMAVWAQFALFTGCAVKGDDKYYHFPGHLLCLDQAPILLHRLSIVAWPWLAFLGFGGGLLCAGWLIFQMQRKAALA